MSLFLYLLSLYLVQSGLRSLRPNGPVYLRVWCASGLDNIWDVAVLAAFRLPISNILYSCWWWDSLLIPTRSCELDVLNTTRAAWRFSFEVNEEYQEVTLDLEHTARRSGTRHPPIKLCIPAIDPVGVQVCAWLKQRLFLQKTTAAILLAIFQYMKIGGLSQQASLRWRWRDRFGKISSFRGEDYGVHSVVSCM